MENVEKRTHGQFEVINVDFFRAGILDNPIMRKDGFVFLANVAAACQYDLALRSKKRLANQEEDDYFKMNPDLVKKDADYLKRFKSLHATRAIKDMMRLNSECRRYLGEEFVLVKLEKDENDFYNYYQALSLIKVFRNSFNEFSGLTLEDISWATML